MAHYNASLQKGLVKLRNIIHQCKYRSVILFVAYWRDYNRANDRSNSPQSRAIDRP